MAFACGWQPEIGDSQRLPPKSADLSAWSAHSCIWESASVASDSFDQPSWRIWISMISITFVRFYEYYTCCSMMSAEKSASISPYLHGLKMTKDCRLPTTWSSVQYLFNIFPQLPETTSKKRPWRKIWNPKWENRPGTKTSLVSPVYSLLHLYYIYYLDVWYI